MALHGGCVEHIRQAVDLAVHARHGRFDVGIFSIMALMLGAYWSMRSVKSIKTPCGP